MTVTTSNSGSKHNNESIRVCVRVRPPLSHEMDCDSTFLSGDNGIVHVDLFIPEIVDGHEQTNGYPSYIGTQRISLHPISNDRTFVMDRVFDINSTQQEVYEIGAKPIVESVLQGFNGAVVVYGQTSSGKTYTMEGPIGLYGLVDDNFSSIQDSLGIVPRMVRTLFRYIESADEHIQFELKVSILEIYNEKLKDLIDPKKMNLRIREDKHQGVFVEDLSEWFVTTPKDVFDCIRLGQMNRATAVTNMNVQSSRSHLIFCLSVHQKNTYDLSIKTGKLYLVDLAGSEKVAKSGAEGQTLDEAKMINKSLACLGNVINALTTAGGKMTRAHIPYRDSKLTRVLQETLGGNSKTCLICTLSPSALNEAETLSTLRFGQRAKLIINKAVINEGRSLEAVERLLVRAEEKIDFLSKYINTLETLLKSNGLKLPSGDRDLPSLSTFNPMASPDSSRIISERSDSSSPWPVASSTRAAAEVFELQEEILIKNGLLKEQSQEISDLKWQVSELMDLLAQYQQQRHEIWKSMEPENSTEEMPATGSMSLTEDSKEIPSAELAFLKHQLLNLQEILQDERKRTSALRAICQITDQPFQQKLEEIDIHLEQLTAMYQNVLDKNSELKLQCKEKDDKIDRKNKSICQLQNNLRDSRQKYERLLETCQSLSEAIVCRPSSSQMIHNNTKEFNDASIKNFDVQNFSPTDPSSHFVPSTSLWNFYSPFHAPNISKRLNIVKPLAGRRGLQRKPQ